VTTRKYYHANKSSLLAKHEAWRKTNRHKLLEYRSKWRKINKAKILSKAKDYYKNNRQKQLETQRKFRAANKEMIRAKQKAYAEAHPEVALRARVKRQARTLGTQSNLELIKRWVRQIRKNPFARCHWCGTKVIGKKVHFDHVIALARGGTHTIGNLCSSCSDCNRSKNARAIADWIVAGQCFLSL